MINQVAVTTSDMSYQDKETGKTGNIHWVWNKTTDEKFRFVISNQTIFHDFFKNANCKAWALLPGCVEYDVPNEIWLDFIQTQLHYLQDGQK